MSLFLVMIGSLVGFILVCMLVMWLVSLRYGADNRTWEAACGLVAALAGCLVLAFTLFGPSYSFESCSGNGSTISSCQTGMTSLLQVGIQPTTLVAFCILLLGLIGVAVGAVVHSRTGGSGWRIVLWVATAVISIHFWSRRKTSRPVATSETLNGPW